MKYQILIKNININVVSLNWYTGTAGKDPWETESEAEALTKYRELLKTNAIDGLSLVQVIPVSIEVYTLSE